jgi:RHS repeat-associated protein
MAGSLLPDTHRFEERVIREYPYAIPGSIRPQDLERAEMFYNADSGLYLTKYRAYDLMAGWSLSRDLIGEWSDPAVDLYPYVGGEPINTTDPDGLIDPRNLAVCLGTLGQVCQPPPPPENFCPVDPDCPPGSLCATKPLDSGGAEWGRRNGYGADAGRRAAHAAKGDDPMQRPTDDYKIDPDTGDVYDPEGHPIGNAGDYVGKKR